MQSLSVQALTLRQLGRLTLSPRQLLLTPGNGPHWTDWCPRTLHRRQLWGSTAFPCHGGTHGGTHKLLSSAVDPATSWSAHHARFKSSKKKGGVRATQEEEEEEEDPERSDYEDELEDDPSVPKDYKDLEKFVQSFRYDVILKAGLDIARNKVEDALYSNTLRLNGQKLVKKSKVIEAKKIPPKNIIAMDETTVWFDMVKVGDTLDLILSDNKELDTVTLMRVVVKKVLGESKDGDKVKIALRRWKHMELPKSDAFKQ